MTQDVARTAGRAGDRSHARPAAPRAAAARAAATMKGSRSGRLRIG